MIIPDTLTPRFATLHLLCFSAMIYAEDCMEHPSREIQVLAAQIRKHLKRYIDTLDNTLNRDMIDAMQRDIDEALKYQMVNLYGDNIKDIHYSRMLIYLEATRFACYENMKYQRYLKVSLLAPMRMLDKVLGKYLASKYPAARHEGKQVFDAVLTLNTDEFQSNK